MSDIAAVFSQITGKPATSEQIQRLRSFAHTVGIRNDDPLLLYFAALDAHVHIIDGLAERAKAIGDAAAAEAHNAISSQLADLLPTIQNGLETGAEKAAQRIQWGKSVLSIWGALIAISLTFALGWFTGGAAVGHADLSRWGLASGIATPVVLFAGMLLASEDHPFVRKAGWVLFTAAIVCCVGLGLLLWKALGA